MTPAVFNALTIAGSDSGGGAGIQADLKTFSACGVYGASVITALTAQNTQHVHSVHSVPSEFIAEQLDAVFSDIEIHAVKTGMLGGIESVIAVADAMEKYGVNQLVVDPVMISTSGNALLQADAVSTLKERLFPLATLITPNLPEAAALLDSPEAETLDEMKDTAVSLYRLGAKNVLLKGGHLSGDISTDILYDGKNFWDFPSCRVKTKNTHGTGCTLASAITAGLANGRNVAESVTQAKKYITSAIMSADQLNVGSGLGPVHHFHALWRS